MSVFSQFARAICGAGSDLKSQEEVNSAGYPPADLSLGRAASIRTCLAARKQRIVMFCKLGDEDSENYARGLN